MSKLYVDLKSIMRSFQWLLTQPLQVKGLGERTHEVGAVTNFRIQHLVSRIYCWDPNFWAQF